MTKFKQFIFVIIFLIPVFLVPSLVMGQENGNISTNVNYEKINMKDGSRFFLKRAKEKLFLFLLSPVPEKKLSYYQKLLSVRLSELKYVVDNKDISNIQVASQRYFTTAGQLTNLLLSKTALANNKEALKQLFSEHVKIIEVLEKSYHNTTAEWRLLRDDVNYLIDYSNALK